MSHLEIYIDGASKGNPGHSGVGIVILREGRVIKSISGYIGKVT
ncbi:MAG: ribonuclease H, partial [Candidatus Omnitrophota bacterium]|nr:ribonuclease H [Candidatus Omnitrophota bacterium]